MATVNYFPMIKAQRDIKEYFASDMTSLDLVPHEYDTSYVSSRCPARKELWRNTWTIKSPSDITFDVWPKQKKITLGGKMSKFAFDELFDIDDGAFVGTYPECQIMIQYVMWSYEPNIWVEMKNTMDMAKQGVELVDGTFCISAWTRPLNIGMRLHKEKYHFPEGMDLAHIKLTDRNKDSNINLVRQDSVPEDVLNNWNQGTRYTTFFPFKSWSLIKKRVKNGFRIS